MNIFQQTLESGFYSFLHENDLLWSKKSNNRLVQDHVNMAGGVEQTNRFSIFSPVLFLLSCDVMEEGSIFPIDVRRALYDQTFFFMDALHLLGVYLMFQEF